MKIGDRIENKAGEAGTVINIREGMVTYNILRTGGMAKAPIHELKTRENPKEINTSSGEMNMSMALLEQKSQEYGLPINDLQRIWKRSMSAWKPGMPGNPQIYAAAKINEACQIAKDIHEKNQINAMFESQLMGTDESRLAYQSMTPGEPGYGTEPKKKKKKKMREEIGVGDTIDAALYGNPSSGWGIGSGASIALPISEAILPKHDSIRKWVFREDIQKQFINRYGENASKKLVEAAHRMFKTLKEVK